MGALVIASVSFALDRGRSIARLSRRRNHAPQQRPHRDQPRRQPAAPGRLIAANQARQAGGDVDEARFQTQLHAAVVDVVRRQQQLGIDIPGDGEFGKAMGHRVNYGAWWSYSFQRLGGLDLAGPGLYEMPPAVAHPARWC